MLSPSEQDGTNKFLYFEEVLMPVGTILLEAEEGGKISDLCAANSASSSVATNSNFGMMGNVPIAQWGSILCLASALCGCELFRWI
mmetsp:Transcript_9553/g.23798  ORF Transcript_9553/g.23798 Transcript_9553/m.23798 type:complete len:86 (+) Transcript_9553:1073-1330(+)